LFSEFKSWFVRIYLKRRKNCRNQEAGIQK
jgi:hypothetical protein